MTHGPQRPPEEFVAAPDPRAGRRRSAWGDWWRRARVLLVVAIALALAVISLLLYTSDRRATRQSELVVPTEQAEALRQRSLQLEASFERIRQERFELKEEDIALLQEALRLQEEYIVARQSVGTLDARQESLRRRLHLIRAERLRHESEEAEAKALALAKTDESAAVPPLRRAVECEREIEARWEYSGLADPGRRARLDTRLRRLESGDLWKKGRQLEAEAEAALAAGRFADAAARFGQAIDAETEFLARYRDVRDTEYGRSDKLADRRETALSGEAWKAVKSACDKAEAAEKSGDQAGAVREWQAAVDGFAQLLLDHPRSAYADRAEEAKMAVRLNRARFHGEIAAVREGGVRLRAALRARRADEAVRLLEPLVGEARRLASANAGVFLPADEERRELEYLSANVAVLRSLLPTVDERLLPVPGSPARMYRTEIPQGLYASVMGANPSSLRREANPVESVTYAEAEDFAVRFGWLTGTRARLPTAAEYAAAIGELGRQTTRDQAWTADNTDGQAVRAAGTSAPNAAGFHDLLGNVEEWAGPPSGEPRALVVGGALTAPFPRELPVRPLFKRERSRTLGFRIVIE